MNLKENIRIALRALAANKMRSILTMLGIIIGVGAVVALMAIGQGATNSITSSVEGLGSNLISITAGKSFTNPTGTQTNRLYYEDYQVLAENLTGVTAMAPSYQKGYTVKSGDVSSQYSVTGVLPQMQTILSYTVADGRFITDGDQKTASRVAVLGAQTAKDLFSGLNPIGKKIRIGAITFEVVGVLEEKGSAGMGVSQDDVILIPLETGYSRLFGSDALYNGKRVVSSISIAAANADVINDVTAQSEFILRKQHRTIAGEENDFNLMTQSDFLSTLSTITSTLTTFLAAIAGISLLVGGIGIMNIMLVSVTERTREIGLRKAVGAKRRVILMQFLVETLILSLLGGTLGVGLGVGLAALSTALNLITAQVTLSTILLAFFFAAAVGIFFGLYPAVQASRLRPIEALRYE